MVGVGVDAGGGGGVCSFVVGGAWAWLCAVMEAALVHGEKALSEINWREVELKMAASI